MTSPDLYSKCTALFEQYPDAVTEAGNARGMVLMSEDGYFDLAKPHAKEAYSAWNWPSDITVTIHPDGHGQVPPDIAGAITRGTPVPRNGSMFGWVSDGRISALVVIYSDHRADPVPNWSVAPLAGTQEAFWPPLAGEAMAGNWSWDYVRQGRLVNLKHLIAGNPETVYWATDMGPEYGAVLCAVTRDIADTAGRTLPSGVYAYYKVLRELRASGGAAPSPAEVAARGTDLAPRFTPRPA